jgi:hypothetical protein
MSERMHLCHDLVLFTPRAIAALQSVVSVALVLFHTASRYSIGYLMKSSALVMLYYACLGRTCPLQGQSCLHPSLPSCPPRLHGLFPRPRIRPRLRPQIQHWRHTWSSVSALKGKGATTQALDEMRTISVAEGVIEHDGAWSLISDQVFNGS